MGIDTYRTTHQNSRVRVALILGAFLVVAGLVANALYTREPWALMAATFAVGATVILGRLAWVHRLPGLPWRIRKLGPLPKDPGMPKKPEVDGDPFRD